MNLAFGAIGHRAHATGERRILERERIERLQRTIDLRGERGIARADTRANRLEHALGNVGGRAALFGRHQMQQYKMRVPYESYQSAGSNSSVARLLSIGTRNERFVVNTSFGESNPFCERSIAPRCGRGVGV